MSLMAPLHRQYKTARTETLCHLLLKTWQMAIQTSASRGYVLLRGAIRDTHKSPTNCLPGCGHDPRSAPNLERHGSSKMQTSGWLEMPHFLNPISICIPAEIPECVSYNITYQRKAQYAYCGGFFLCRNRYLCEDASRISPMIVSMEFVILLCSMASI